MLPDTIAAMTDRLAVGIAGSLFAPSRSGALVSAVLGSLEPLGFGTRLIDLAGLPAEGLLARRKDAAVDEAGEFGGPLDGRGEGCGRWRRCRRGRWRGRKFTA